MHPGVRGGLTHPPSRLSNPARMRFPPPLPAAALLAVLLAFATPSRGAVVRPWTPANADTVATLAADAKVRFQAATVDTLSESGIRPFESVGQAARRLLRRLGRERVLLAPTIEDSLDALGLDTDVVLDPRQPHTVFVLVRNPYRPAMQSVGYLLWWRNTDLRMQGVSFPPAVQPRIATWWTGRAGVPYATAILYRERGGNGDLGFKFLRLSGDGYYWDLVQYEGNGPELGGDGEAYFNDLDRDGLPELVAWSKSPPDSVLRVLAPVRPILREAIFTEHRTGFVAHDARLVPGPLATLRLFVLRLREGDREQAARFLADPALLEDAIAQGWHRTTGPAEFVVDRQEEGTAWPEWLGARVRGVDGARRWVFHFTLRDGRWLIREWIGEVAPPAAGARSAPGKTGGNP